MDLFDGVSSQAIGPRAWRGRHARIDDRIAGQPANNAVNLNVQCGAVISAMP